MTIKKIWYIFIIIITIILFFSLTQGEELIQKTAQPIYCAEAGGYPKDQRFKFPIETREKARAALAYAFWAPYPDGIRACVCFHYSDFPSCKKN